MLNLHIKAIEAKNLPRMDVAPYTVDPYLTFRLSSNPSKITKTKYIKQNYNPVWNEEIHLKVNPELNEVLHVELFDHDTLSKDDLISTRDFELSYFPLGKVVDSYHTFFKARGVKKPGQVRLAFHLAKEGDEPFVEKFYLSTRGNIAPEPLTEEEQLEAAEKFKIIDQNRNGRLEEEELDAYFRQERKELRCFPKLVIQLFGENGTVSAQQFFAFYKSLCADPKSDQFIGRYIFDYIDKDKSGTIEASEYQKVIALIQIPEGFAQETLDRVSTMNYEQFSQHFYVFLRQVWGGLIRQENRIH